MNFANPHKMDPCRVKMLSVFTMICEQAPEWGTLCPKRQGEIIRRLERSCLNQTVIDSTENGINRVFTDQRFLQRYSSICSKILFNLELPHLIPALVQGAVLPENVATMTSEDLYPPAAAEEREYIARRQATSYDKKASRNHTCRKCHGNLTTKVEFQSKAADETSNFSVKCMLCGYTWII